MGVKSRGYAFILGAKQIVCAKFSRQSSVYTLWNTFVSALDASSQRKLYPESSYTRENRAERGHHMVLTPI